MANLTQNTGLKLCLMMAVGLAIEGLCAATGAAPRGQGVDDGVHRLAVRLQVLPVRHQVRVLTDLVQARQKERKKIELWTL
jgi:hypothetical protein